MFRAKNARNFAAAMVAALFLSVIGLGAAPAMASQTASATGEITTAQFPTKAKVKSIYRGTGSWFRGIMEPNTVPVGARPSECRSDLPFAAATHTRAAIYGGPLRKVSGYSARAYVEIYRFPSRALASEAIERAGAFATVCPTSVEWVCEDCDGIWTSYRTPAAAREVGTESVAWNERREGMGVHSGRVIVARSKAVVVAVYAAHATNPEIMDYPPTTSWSRTEALARAALKSATGS